MVQAGGRRLRPLAIALLLPLLPVLVGAGIVVRDRLERPAPLPRASAVVGARSGAALAWDPDEQAVVLFGGQTQEGTDLGDTWSWDGQRWHQLRPPVSPPPRSSAALAWDPGIHRLVLFGGLTRGSDTDSVADTWTWDGRSWQQLSGPLVGVSGQAGLAYDPSRHRLLLVANTRTELPTPRWTPPPPGMPSSAPPTISWSWDLRTWSLVASGWVEQAHAALAGWLPGDPAVGYDPVARRLILLQRSAAFFCVGAMGVRVATPAGATLVETGSGPGAESSNPSGRPVATGQLFSPPPAMSGPPPDPGCGFAGSQQSLSASPRWWDGSAWRTGGLNGLRGTVEAAPLQDPQDGRLTVLQGGEFWSWTGHQWRRRSQASPFGDRLRAGLAADSARGEVVLVGGEDNSSDGNDT